MLNELSIRAYGAVTAVIADIKDALHNDERGQDLLEYALIGGLISVAIVIGWLLFQDAVADMTTAIADCIDFDVVAGASCADAP